jgi:hypothetical protein
MRWLRFSDSELQRGQELGPTHPRLCKTSHVRSLSLPSSQENSLSLSGIHKFPELEYPRRCWDGGKLLLKREVKVFNCNQTGCIAARPQQTSGSALREMPATFKSRCETNPLRSQGTAQQEVAHSPPIVWQSLDTSRSNLSQSCYI